MAAHTAAHDALNPDQVADRRAERQARTVAAGPKASAAELAGLRQRQKDQCAYCLAPLFLGGHVDHMVPLARGGTNDASNLVYACEQCNTEKHAKTAREYLFWRSERGLPNHASAYAYEALKGSGKCAP
ncbi:hypothetical protein GCM10028794_24100 [Silanimonas algicola]